MSVLTSPSPDLSEALPTLNAVTSSFNAYPFILETSEDHKRRLAYRSLLSFDVALIVVHLTLLIQATITLGLKLFLRAKNGKIWLWRKHYLLDHAVPYLVPNGHFIIEPLSIIGAIFFELFSIIVFIVVKKPQIGESLPGLHASCLFWFAVSWVPGFIGFWWSGWSAFYVLFLTPTHTASSGKYTRLFYHPILMNTVCIGVPVLMSSFFIIIGAILSSKHKRVGQAYDVLLTSLHQFSDFWKPNDPSRFNNNEHLFNVFQSILVEGSQILYLLQIMAVGWAVIAVCIIMFYVATAISVGKVTQRTMMMAKGRGRFPKFRSQPTLSMSSLTASGRHDNVDSKTKADHYPGSTPSYQAGAMKNPSFLNIERNLYFLRTSCGLMTVSLGFNFCTSLVFANKIPTLLIETTWQVTLSSLITGSCVLLSFSLFVQSLMHI
ncbi:hypothetical protein PCANC_03356 [Puccinia coronata f. sp. avenae]|uniref:Uncharacterized protein n=1 Tax=Puccinia coronata f. sp. avenae TaxID=200324 RepID=A0A2N5SXE1_9BASI|nr:hypothetical protein PCASD_17136 [Puccinia coronata f. sp. avenae]PLW21875.1 hypothetical protein PCANC_03356 [Puccinia coronata f. sp. avenae]